jgi:hypothetical protein
LTFDFNQCNSKNGSDGFNEIKKVYDDAIIASLFDLIVVMKKPKNFLQNIYDKIILNVLSNSNNDNNLLSHELIIKFIIVYECFCRIYLIYIRKNNEINIIFDKYIDLLKYCKLYIANTYNKNNKIGNNNNDLDLDELNARMINQCILSFSKTSMLSIDHFIKSTLLNISPSFKDKSINNDRKKNRFIFIEKNTFLEFIDSCLYYDGNKNNFSLGIEYANMKDKKFFFLISKGKGILIEALTVIIKKLTKYELFNSNNNFNTLTFNYYCDIVDYLIKFYQGGNYPREKVDNTQTEIIQLSIIVKTINFIDEIIDNQIYKNLIENNTFRINCSNKKEKYIDIFKFIIVPNLLQTDLEKNFFEFDELEYIKNLFDMCHTCEVKLPKQTSIKLLMTLCDSTEGFLDLIVHIYVLILKNITITNNINNTNIQIEDKYKSLYDFLVQNIKSFNLIEQSLQVLTSISYLFTEKPDISDYFCDEIDLINYMLIKIKDPFLKSKLCVFYSYNLEILFHNEEEVLSKSFDDSLNFLFDCIFNKESNLSLIKTSLNCLNEIIFNKYLKKFCVTSVSINALKLIDFFNVKENLSGNEEEFNELIKGLVKEYMYDLGDTSIQLFDYFWNKFLVILNKSNEKEQNFENFVKAGILKDKTKEVNIAMELSTQINLINNFINMIKNKNVEIKNNIYEKIFSLFPNLYLYIITDFEEDILKLLSKVITDVKLLPDSYFAYFQKYLDILNKINNNDYSYAMEKYHLEFIFTCLNSFKRSLIINQNIKEYLINNLGFRLSIVHRCIPLRKIYSEHYIYCDMGLCIDFFFFDNLTSTNKCDLIKIFFNRMEKMPNSDYDLNVKLCLNIFILLIKSENYDIFDEIFMNNKNANLYTLLCKVISFFPYKSLSLVQQQIISIFCSLIIRYLIIKQKNNQKVLISTDKTLSDIDVQNIFFYIFSLNLNQLNIIKKKSSNIMSKEDKKEDEETKKKEIIIDSFEINETNGNNNFKKPRKFVYQERTPHDYSIFKKYDYSNDKENSDNSIDYEAKEDDFLINDDYKNLKKNDENDENDECYDDENLNPLNNNDGEESDLSDNVSDDRDDEFLSVKNEPKNNFMYYYNKFANEELIVYLKGINEFHLFEIMMKDIEINDLNFFNLLLNQIKTSQGENKLKLIEQFKGLQKIEFKNKNAFLYRKILKIQKSNK